jgi:hypothetical protein
MAFEFDLLLNYLQTKSQPDHGLNGFPSCSHTANWNQFGKLAVRHGVAPLLYAQSKQDESLYLPQDVRVLLWAHYQLSAQVNQQMGVELGSMMRGFATAGITAVPLKGIPLAASIYRDIALRPTGDIDLWVLPCDLTRCEKQLQEMGYVAKRPFGTAQQSVWQKANYQQTWTHVKRPFAIDLHWQLMPSYFSISFEPHSPYMMQVIAAEAVPTFSPEDQILFLCLHGFKHKWRRLIWIVDIARLLTTFPDLDWTVVWSHAAQHHIQRIVRLGIMLAHHLFRVSLLPEVQMWAVKDRAVIDLMHSIKTELMLSEFVPPRQYTWQQHRFLMAVRERIRDRLRFSMQRAFTLTEGDLANPYRLPDHHAVYQCIRPFRLLHRFLIQPNK